MRIAIDSHAAEQEGTGNCTYYRNLILGLAELDSKNEYFVLATDKSHPFYSNLRDRPNFKVIEVVKRPAWFRVFLSLCIATYRAKVDILHVQYFSPFTHRGHLINTVHDLSSYRYPEYFSTFERILFKTVLPFSSRRAFRILTASEVSKQDLVTLMRLPEKRVKVTYCGVSESFFDDQSTGKIQDVRQRFGLTGPFFLYIGRIDPRKNLVRLIEAYSRVRSQHAFAHKLVIAGKVYLENQRLNETLKRSLHRDDIRLCGYVPDEDLASLYRAAEVFLYPSEYEGFGLPPLEAMASGTPVVASDIPVFREILSDAAVLVNPRNVQDIADGIYRIVSDERLKKTLVQKGKERARMFTWEKTASITLQAYEEAMRQSS